MELADSKSILVVLLSVIRLVLVDLVGIFEVHQKKILSNFRTNAAEPDKFGSPAFIQGAPNCSAGNARKAVSPKLTIDPTECVDVSEF